METKTAMQDTNKSFNTEALSFVEAASQTAAAAGQKASEIKEGIENKGSEILDATKQTVAEAYNKTSRALSENYQKTMEYGRENPASLSLIALGAGLGAGVGLGFLLANNYSTRSRASRIVPPVMDALTNLTYSLFKR